MFASAHQLRLAIWQPDRTAAEPYGPTAEPDHRNTRAVAKSIAERRIHAHAGGDSASANQSASSDDRANQRAVALADDCTGKRARHHA